MSFKGQTVMITGAAGNLGHAVAAAFAAAGANLVLLDLNEDALKKTPTAGAGDVLRQRVDLSDAASIAAAVDAAMSSASAGSMPCAISPAASTWARRCMRFPPTSGTS